MNVGDNALGEFLRARRELVDPGDVDLPDYGRRRVAGLRREEVAMLAGVSPDYYARLEQGRDRRPSASVLDAVGRALSLDEQALSHLHHLAAPETRRPRRPRRPERVHAGTAQLLRQWREQAAIVVGRYWDVLAANDLAIEVNACFTPGCNLLREVFLEAAARQSFLDWEAIAEAGVAGLRASAGTDLDDPRLNELVGELALKSPEFRRLWARHVVRNRTGGVMRFDHPLVGPLALNVAAFPIQGVEGQTLFVFFAEPGSADHDALTLLAHTAADRGIDQGRVTAGADEHDGPSGEDRRIEQSSSRER